jgi:hypothetical protein
MPKYRRIEVNASRRRVTIISGEWTREISRALSGQTDYGSVANEIESCEAVTPESPEGQFILVEAVRSLEQRLAPEALAQLRADGSVILPAKRSRSGFLQLLQFFRQCLPRNLRTPTTIKRRQ